MFEHQWLTWTAPQAPEKGTKPSEVRIQVVDSLSGVMFLLVSPERDGNCQLKFHRYKDYTDTMPSYMELKEKNFPLSSLSTTQLSPLGLIPEQPFPVMAAQANFIKDGLLLTIGVHHSVCDATAIEYIINTWAHNTTAVTNGSEMFSTYDAVLNDRTPIMKGKPGADLADFPEYVLTPTPPKDTTNSGLDATSTEIPPMTARIFYFSLSSLYKLKNAASAFSTNDALNALIWRRVTMARNPTSGLLSHNKDSRILYAANIRARENSPLPANYLGNASICGATEALSVPALLSASGLSAAAAVIRKSVNGLTADRITSLTGLLNSRADPSDFKFAYNGFLGPDVSMTTWADVEIYRPDWGPFLGKVEAFRVPGEGMDGVVQVFPRLRDGGLEICIGLEDGAMERLVQDAEFGEYAQFWA